MKLKSLIWNIKESFVYFKKAFLLAFAIYLTSFIIAIILFKNVSYSINPVRLPFLRLFLHNTGTLIIIIGAGLISCGVAGNFILVANAVSLGNIIIGVYNRYGIMPIISGVLPHFLFELIATLMATCISYETSKLFYNLRHTNIKTIHLKYDICFLVISIIFVIIAATIESHIKISY
jgi:uncharacterized membrane protein SpoIIM required for sporulation